MPPSRVEQQSSDYRPNHTHRLYLRLRAPFAAWRPMQAGAHRSTLPVMPYSAAWGLALNLAGIEARSDHPDHHGTDPFAPPLRLCIGHTAKPDQAISSHTAALPADVNDATGAMRQPQPSNSLYQHLHGYPIGRSSQRFERGAHGAKYHIAPARREILTDLDLILGIEEAASAATAANASATPTAAAPTSVIARIQTALAGTAPWPRHGLPFAGDNNHCFDHIDPLTAIPPAHWYTPVDYHRTQDPTTRPGTTRLHLSIDRHDSSRTTTREVAPTAPTTDIPPTAWVWTPHPPYLFASGR